jgi:hypothetical protein
LAQLELTAEELEMIENNRLAYEDGQPDFVLKGGNSDESD